MTLSRRNCCSSMNARPVMMLRQDWRRPSCSHVADPSGDERCALLRQLSATSLEHAERVQRSSRALRRRRPRAMGRRFTAASRAPDRGSSRPLERSPTVDPHPAQFRDDFDAAHATASCARSASRRATAFITTTTRAALVHYISFTGTMNKLGDAPLPVLPPRPAGVRLAVNPCCRLPRGSVLTFPPGGTLTRSRPRRGATAWVEFDPVAAPRWVGSLRSSEQQAHASRPPRVQDASGRAGQTLARNASTAAR